MAGLIICMNLDLRHHLINKILGGLESGNDRARTIMILSTGLLEVEGTVFFLLGVEGIVCLHMKVQFAAI